VIHTVLKYAISVLCHFVLDWTTQDLPVLAVEKLIVHHPLLELALPTDSKELYMSFKPTTLHSTDQVQYRLKGAQDRFLYSSTAHWFKEEDLARLRTLVSQDRLKQGTVAEAVVGDQIANPDIRDAWVEFIDPNEHARWLYDRVGEIIRFHNQTYYGYDLTGIETLQFSEYRAPSGHYGAHLDWGSARNGVQAQARKLSFTVQLSDPDSYEGGDLVIHDGQTQDPAIIAKRRAVGSIIVFPSWVLHEVTPVTKGTRRSLVGWCVGPEFR